MCSNLLKLAVWVVLPSGLRRNPHSTTQFWLTIFIAYDECCTPLRGQCTVLWGHNLFPGQARSRSCLNNHLDRASHITVLVSKVTLDQAFLNLNLLANQAIMKLETYNSDFVHVTGKLQDCFYRANTIFSNLSFISKWNVMVRDLRWLSSESAKPGAVAVSCWLALSLPVRHEHCLGLASGGSSARPLTDPVASNTIIFMRRRVLSKPRYVVKLAPGFLLPLLPPSSSCGPCQVCSDKLNSSEPYWGILKARARNLSLPMATGLKLGQQYITVTS